MLRDLWYTWLLDVLGFLRIATWSVFHSGPVWARVSKGKIGCNLWQISSCALCHQRWSKVPSTLLETESGVEFRTGLCVLQSNPPWRYDLHSVWSHGTAQANYGIHRGVHRIAMQYESMGAFARFQHWANPGWLAAHRWLVTDTRSSSISILAKAICCTLDCHVFSLGLPFQIWTMQSCRHWSNSQKGTWFGKLIIKKNDYDWHSFNSLVNAKLMVWVAGMWIIDLQSLIIHNVKFQCCASAMLRK